MQHNSSPESRYRFIFESANVGLWEEDYSQVKRALDELQRQGVRDLRAHLLAHPEQVRELMGLVRILDVNEETLKMHGARSKDELLGSLARIAVPEAGPVFLEALVAIAEGHNHFEAEVPGKTLQGERIDTIIRLTVPRDTEGFRNLIVSTVDISARKAMERALRQSEERYRAIFEGAKVSLWEEDVSGLKAALNGLTAQGVGAIRPYLDAHPEFVASCLERIRILGVNRETLRLYEAESESELLGSLSGVFTPESVEGFKGLLVAVAEGRSFIEEEIKARTLRGRPIDTLLSAAMPDTEEGFKHLIVSIVDLTEHRRLEREMQKAQKLESLGVLAGGIAHDFNNILTAILGNVSLLAAAGLAAPEAGRMLEDLRKAVLRAQGLTQQLLTFSRGGEPVRRRLRLKGLVADTVAFALSGSNVVARFEIPEGLWAVDADEGQLAQVFHNLTVNAKQAMPGGGSLTVRAANHRDRDGRRFLKIALQDHGVGIPERHLIASSTPTSPPNRKAAAWGSPWCTRWCSVTGALSRWSPRRAKAASSACSCRSARLGRSRSRKTPRSPPCPRARGASSSWTTRR